MNTEAEPAGSVPLSRRALPGKPCLRVGVPDAHPGVGRCGKYLDTLRLCAAAAPGRRGEWPQPQGSHAAWGAPHRNTRRRRRRHGECARRRHFLLVRSEHVAGGRQPRSVGPAPALRTRSAEACGVTSYGLGTCRRRSGFVSAVVRCIDACRPPQACGGLESYLGADRRLCDVYTDPRGWSCGALLNGAASMKFSRDRTIAGNMPDILGTVACPVQ
jgi:hypothetical protein